MQAPAGGGDPAKDAADAFAQVDGVVVEVALQWCSDSFSDMLVSFVNSVKTIDGGTHIDGLKAGRHSLWLRPGTTQPARAASPQGSVPLQRGSCHVLGEPARCQKAVRVC